MKKVNLLAVLFGMLFLIPACTLLDYDLDSDEQNNILSIMEAKSSTEKHTVVEDEEVGLKSGEIHKINFKSTLDIRSGPIGPGSEINLEVEGTGTIPHMGRSKLTMNKTVTTYSYPDPPKPWNAFAEVILTNARGDELHFYYNKCLVDRSETPKFIFKTECIIRGGTGRYKNAKGTIEYHESFYWNKSVGTLKLTGTIYY